MCFTMDNGKMDKEAEEAASIGVTDQSMRAIGKSMSLVVMED
jgi:hypothetical protein